MLQQVVRTSLEYRVQYYQSALRSHHDHVTFQCVYSLWGCQSCLRIEVSHYFALKMWIVQSAGG